MKHRFDPLIGQTLVGDESAAEELFELTVPAVSFMLQRKGSPDAKSDAELVVRTLLQAVRDGAIQGWQSWSHHALQLIRSMDWQRIPTRTTVPAAQPELSHLERDVLDRYYVQRHSIARIAADLGMTESSVESVKSRARQQFTRNTGANRPVLELNRMNVQTH